MTTALMAGRTLRRGLLGTLAMLIAVLVFEVVIPPVAEEVGTEQLDPVLESLPPAVLALTRTTPELVVVSGLQGYLSIGFTSPVYLLLISAALVAYTATALAGEMERGTIQIALSRRVSRMEVYGSRVLSVVLLVALFGAIGPLGVLLGLRGIDPAEPVAESHLIVVGFASLLYLWSVAGVTTFFSAVASRTGQVVGWSLAWLILSYFIDYFATFWSFLENFTPLSVFTYYDPTSAIVFGEIPAEHWVVLGATGAAGFLAGAAVFLRRDLPA